MKKIDRLTIKSCIQNGFTTIILGIILSIILAPSRITEIPVPAFELGAGMSIIVRMFGFIWLVYDEKEFMKIIRAKDLKDKN